MVALCSGNILLAARNRNEADYARHLQVARSELMAPLSAASMEVGSYQRGYQYIVRLHMLTELQHGMRTLFDLDARLDTSSDVTACDVNQLPAAQREQLLRQWKKRLQYTQSSFKTQEPILNLRRSMLSMAAEEQQRGMAAEEEIGHCWLSTARIARQ